MTLPSNVTPAGYYSLVHCNCFICDTALAHPVRILGCMQHMLLCCDYFYHNVYISLDSISRETVLQGPSKHIIYAVSKICRTT